MSILRTTLRKFVGEVVLYLFDFSNFPEVVSGETLSSPSVPAVPGLTIGTPAVTSEIRDGIAAGKAVEVTISGGAADTIYEVQCAVATSGGSTRIVKGALAVD